MVARPARRFVATFQPAEQKSPVPNERIDWLFQAYVAGSGCIPGGPLDIGLSSSPRFTRYHVLVLTHLPSFPLRFRPYP